MVILTVVLAGLIAFFGKPWWWCVILAIAMIALNILRVIGWWDRIDMPDQGQHIAIMVFQHAIGAIVGFAIGLLIRRYRGRLKS
jgi:hypothetical protein